MVVGMSHYNTTSVNSHVRSNFLQNIKDPCHCIEVKMEMYSHM